jgi:hypothetical protein
LIVNAYALSQMSGEQRPQIGSWQQRAMMTADASLATLGGIATVADPETFLSYLGASSVGAEQLKLVELFGYVEMGII